MKGWRRKPGSGGEHEEVFALLPWYVNHTLEARETARVAAHLATCPECSRELRRCRGLAVAVQEAGQAAPSPHPVKLSRLLARIDAHELSRGRLRRLGASLHRFALPFQQASPTLRRALAVQLALLVALGAVLAWQSRSPQPEAATANPGATGPAAYRTLSDGPAAAVAAPRLRVLFAQEIREEEMRRLLLELRAEIVGGPSPFGAYTLRLPPAGPGSDPLAEVVDHLRSQPQVRFVEVIGTPGGRPR